MAILTSDYKHIQNGQPQDYNTTKEYREDFKNQDIASAQALITSDNNYLVMDADKLNDLCDTINYMQHIWEDDKGRFALMYKRMCGVINCIQPSPDEPVECWVEILPYDPSHVFNTGDIVKGEDSNDNYYFCISDNTTGTWDNSKWLRIGYDDVGLDFIGGIAEGTTPSPTQNQLYIEQPLQWHGLLPWKCGTEIVGYTYPNIRYLTENMTPYTGEIYMCDYEGGEG